MPRPDPVRSAPPASLLARRRAATRAAAHTAPPPPHLCPRTPPLKPPPTHLGGAVPDMSNFYEQHKAVQPYLITEEGVDTTVENFQTKENRAKLDGTLRRPTLFGTSDAPWARASRVPSRLLFQLVAAQR